MFFKRVLEKSVPQAMLARVVGGARVVSGAKKKPFDRGGPVWPPRSNVRNDRLGVGRLGGQSPPRPPPKRPFATFDRGGQTGPPRSNDFFFGAVDDTGAADERPSGRIK